MNFIRGLAFLLLLSATLPSAAARKPSHSPLPGPPAGSAVSPAPLTQQDVQNMRDDLQHMKDLVQQMQANLAFVDTSQSPLKHQFQLEIDMWRLMIQRMEKRLPPAHNQ